jgi:hypothetical protein
MFALKNSSDELLVFYDVPKNASTTIKKLFIDHLEMGDQFGFYGEEYIDPQTGKRVSNLEKSADYKEQKGSKKNKDFHDFAQNRPFSTVGSEIKCRKVCVIRKPMERFISCYNHLVIVNKEFDATPDEILDRVIDGTMRNNHFFPQTHFLGTDPNYYDKIYNTRQLDILEKDMNTFFGKKNQVHHYQTSGSSVVFPRDLDQSFKDKVHKAYKSDYETFGDFF